MDNETLVIEQPAAPETPKSETMAEFKTRMAGGTPTTEAIQSAPKAPEPEGQSAEVSETSKESHQETGEKRDRSYRGRVKELIASGRIDLAEKLILENTGKEHKEHKERAEKAEKELQEIRTRKPAEPEPPKREAAKEAPKDDPEPKQDDFQTYDAYLRAAARYDARQELKAARETDRAEADKNAEADRVKKHQARVQEQIGAAKAKYADYDAMIEASPKDVVMNDGMKRAFHESDALGDLVYHLAKAPEEYRSIAAMSDKEAYRAVLRFEDKLSTKTTPETLKPPVVIRSNATPPPPKAGSGGTSSDPEPRDANNMREFKRNYAAKHKTG